MDSKSFNLIVIGSGPAGEKAAAQAAYFGKSVALVEREAVLGGAAANTGTLPSKTLRESALYLSGFQQRGLYGMTVQFKEKVTARDFLFHERLVVQSEQARIADNIRHRSKHIEQAINAHDQRETFCGYADRGQHHGQGDHAGTWNSRRTHRSQGCRNNDGHLIRKT